VLIYILKKQYESYSISHLNRELTLNQWEVDTRFAGYARSSIGRDGDGRGSSCFDHPAGRAPRPAMALARGRDPRH